MKKFGLILIATLFVLGLSVGIISELFLPGYYEERVEANLREQLEEVEDLNVQIYTRPALLLLKGQVQQGMVRAKGVRLSAPEIRNLRIESLEAHYRDLVITDSPEGELLVTGTNTIFQAVFAEEDLNHYLAEHYSDLGFDQLELKLSQGLAILHLQTTFLNQIINLELRGNFILTEDNTNVRFVPEGFEIVGLRLPNILLTEIFKNTEFDLKLEQLPLPLVLTEIRLEKERLIVVGGEGALK